jgi:hypothetical protein
MAFAALNADLWSSAFFVYLPTSIANIFLTFPINDKVVCTPCGDLNLINDSPSYEWVDGHSQHDYLGLYENDVQR